MKLYSYILNTMNPYFNNNISDWRQKYKKKALEEIKGTKGAKKIEHDEPWLTLISMYSIFDNQGNHNLKNSKLAFEELLSKSGFLKSVTPTNIERVLLEVKLPEIIDYRKYLYSSFEKELFHLYPDRNKMIKGRLTDQKVSLEGSTNLDLLISFIEEKIKKVLFVEAKFMSDIDTKTTYNPVRNQIIRNIDAMIDFVEKNEECNFKDVYFALLTPKMFRTDEYGGGKSTSLDRFSPSRGRIYKA